MKRPFLAGTSLAVVLFAVACSSNTVVAGAPANPDAGTDAGIADASGGTLCTSARDQLLVPVDKISTGAVTVLSDTGGTKLIYVDASAGGIGAAAKNPRIYIDLSAGTRVDVTDVSATTSTGWDLALKRVVIYTNSGDAGPGAGGALEIDQSYDSITAAQVTGAAVTGESFFDADCNPKLDPTDAPLTTFSNWYDYDVSTMIPTADPNRSFAVRGATGKLYKVGIKAYDALADGGSRNNMSTGYYLLQVTEVTQ